MYSSFLHSLRILLFAPLLILLLPVSTAAQTVSVQNGATVQVQNEAVWNLEDGTMDFGPAGTTATLSEQSGGRVSGGQLTATRTASSRPGDSYGERHRTERDTSEVARTS